MKEFSIEQKAKRYDEAIERAKNTIEVNKTIPDIVECIESLFPELTESEDERIRKELLSVVNDLVLPDEQRSRFVAWLEKQGEQELTVIIPKFKAGQTIKYIGDFTIYPEFFTISKVGEAHYFDKNGFTIPIKNQDQWELVEQKLADKVDQHSLPVSDDSSLPTFDESIYHPCTKEAYEQNPTEWSKEDEEKMRSIFLGIEAYSPSIIYGNGKEEVLNWLKSLKDRVQPQPKQEWSKEDEPLKELAKTYLAVFDKHFPILPTLKGKQLADYKNFLNQCQQIFGLKEWGIRPIQSKLFEKLSLLWAAWGAEHLQGVGRQDEKEQDIPVSEELEEACEQLAEKARKHKAETTSPFFNQTDYRQGIMDGAKWQKEKDDEEKVLIYKHGFEDCKEQMMENIIDAQCFGFQGAALFSFRLPADNYLVGSKVKVIVIKED